MNERTNNFLQFKVKRSKLIGLINWSHVIWTFAPHALALALLTSISQLIYNYAWLGANPVKDEFMKVLNDAYLEPVIFTVGLKTSLIFCGIIYYIAKMDNPVYLINFSTFEPPSSWKVSHDQIVEMMKKQNCFTDESISFMRRILGRSGTGQATAWPPGIVQCLEGKDTDNSIEGSRKEAEIVITNIVDKAFRKAKISPKEVDILVINCSLFTPTPSLCAMVISKFGMRSDVQSYNLGGMGCSASLISIDLAKNLLQRRGMGGIALVISTETITPNLYHGNERGFLLQNTLFRCGGAAMVLSNKVRQAALRARACVRAFARGNEATSEFELLLFLQHSPSHPRLYLTSYTFPVVVSRSCRMVGGPCTSFSTRCACKARAKPITIASTRHRTSPETAALPSPRTLSRLRGSAWKRT